MIDVQEYLTSKVDKDEGQGLPILSEEDWAYIHSEISRDQFREEISKWIVTNKPPYPRKISIQNPQKANNKFLDLCTKNMDKHIIPKERTKDVLEKFDDYQRPYETHGLGVIDCGAEYNIVSDYFMYEERMKCGSTHSSSPMEKWVDEKQLVPLFKYFYRMGNKQLQLGTYIGAFRFGSYLATQFKPTVAKCVYTMTQSKKVLDTSCGWGDRLTAFYATPKAEEYVGCDPNGDVWKKYQDLCIHFEKLLSNGTEPKLTVSDNVFTSEGVKKVTIYRSGAEDLPWNELNDFDCTFTSPPYFATERYGEGGDFEDDQSWKKFGEYESWRDSFFIPVSENSYKSLKDGGYCMINILDPVVKGKRYRAGDDLIDHMEAKYNKSFIGQIGMRYMQRAKKLPKEELDKFMAKCYIENVWVFRKGDKGVPLFNSGLESFFV